MNLLLSSVIVLSVPLIVGGIVHMIAVKADMLSYLKKPIHHRWFGLNKTWRGFIIMPLATWPGVLLAQKVEGLFSFDTPLLKDQASLYVALLLGLGYCLAELPNSFMKRKLGIKEGQTSAKSKWFFIIIDQADSAFGCLFAYLIIIDISWDIFFATIVFGTGLHLLLNMMLYKLKLRNNPY